MASNNYRLRLVESGREFEAEGNEKFIDRMLARFWAAASAANGDGRARTARPGSAAKPTKPASVVEFIRPFGATKHTDLALLFGYYLEKQAGLADFTAADINNCYYEAKLESSNTSQMLINNIKTGRMMEAKGSGAKKRYRLTVTGEKAVAKMQKDAAAAE